MTRIRWEAQSVKEKIAALPTHRERKQARRAWKYLMTAEDSSYKLFYKKHKAFLAKTKDDGESQSSSDEPSEATAKQKQRQRQLPLNYIETIGLECAIWPHLYWATDMCETAIRARNRLGKDSGSESSSEEDDESDGKEEGAKQRHSLKGSYIAKVLGPLIGYGTDYCLFQFVYDLHLWSLLGAKRTLRGSAGEVPLRILCSSFSPLYW